MTPNIVAILVEALSCVPAQCKGNNTHDDEASLYAKERPTSYLRHTGHPLQVKRALLPPHDY